MDYTKKICCVPCLETIKSLKTKCEDLNKLISLESKKMFIYSTLQNLGGHNCKSFIKKAVSEGYIKWNEEYEVEDIIDHCNEEGDVFYLIKWKGWASKFNSWEPEKHLKCTDLLNEYHKQNRLKRKRKLDSTNNVHSERNKERTEDLFLKVVEAVENYDGLLDMISDYVQLRKKSTLRKKNLKKNSRSETWQALKQWENDINHTAKSYDAAYLYVENKVDFEGPPENFVYINERKEGPGVKIPKDPLIGCECTDCFENKKNCCPAMSESSLAYYKANRRLRVGRGVPIFECNKRCKCGPDCCNRVVQKGRKFPMCIFRTENGRGWGVKTLKCIKKGSFVVEYVGEVITNEEAENRGKYYDAVGHTYLFDLDFNESDALYTVDAGKYGNAAHFINHSCDPNLDVHVVWIDTLDPQLPHICLFARRDIQANEELTFDYMGGMKLEKVPEHNCDTTETELTALLTESKALLTESTPPPSDTESNESTSKTLDKYKFSMACLCGSSICRKVLFCNGYCPK